MKVKELISKLKEMPQNLDVLWQDHDHSEYEWNNRVGEVSFLSKEKAKDMCSRRGVKSDLDHLYGKDAVYLRP